MRLSLSRVATLFALGAALAAVPGVPVSRGNVRDGSARVVTRGGSYRFNAAETILHLPEGSGAAPESAVTDDSGPGTTIRRDGHHSPAVVLASELHAPLAVSRLALMLAAGGPPGTERSLRPPGRAPPLA